MGVAYGVVEPPWQAAQACTTEYVTELHWQVLEVSANGPSYSSPWGRAGKKKSNQIMSTSEGWTVIRLHRTYCRWNMHPPTWRPLRSEEWLIVDRRTTIRKAQTLTGIYVLLIRKLYPRISVVLQSYRTWIKLTYGSLVHVALVVCVQISKQVRGFWTSLFRTSAALAEVARRTLAKPTDKTYIEVMGGRKRSWEGTITARLDPW